MEIESTAWEANEDIILINGKPTGGTLSRNDARVVKNWLQSSIAELLINSKE